MGLVEAIVLGLVQGLTEFLPISSTAHLRIVPALLGWGDPGAAFTAVIQLGTVLAVLIYFSKDLGHAISAWARSIGGKERDSDDARMGWAVFWGSIPVVIVGLLLKSRIETSFRSLYVIAGSMIFMAVVMALAEKFGKKIRPVESVTTKDGIVVGLWQVLPLIPGMSRSGSTISGALFQGFDRVAAARFSFLLSVPSVTAAGIFEAVKERRHIHDLLVPTLVAMVVAFVVGYASIAFLISFLQRRGLGPFVAYRILLGIVIIGLVAKGVLPENAGADVKEAKPVAMLAH